ncbi:SEL1-like repeat protein [Salinisphaera sp. G21_0]|uniref:tetratricopeptide repeat protein n=1 Tax=Salinisphaera sp. G21_0 TaxID=2821094 RepID=UPI001ADB9D41|nr:SEL1-like repeat protein [Salinisphaera sp. G21_0]MBO9480984.1 sel1 repeat family protein [Salinisphaera sp. G21_0]
MPGDFYRWNGNRCEEYLQTVPEHHIIPVSGSRNLTIYKNARQGLFMLKQVKSAVSLVVLLVTVAGPVWATTPVSGVVAQKEQKEPSVSGKVQGQLSEAIQILHSGQAANPAKAINALQRIARQGDQQARAEAMLWLGRAYRDGLAGTAKDIGTAFDYFQQAAGREGLNSEAQYELGRAYLNGEGTDRNLIAAYMWTELSLQAPSNISASAKAQKARLETLLNTVQLEKARQLVDQLATLYLQ